ncbi:MAG TPA: extracellular solute-binding protein [Desulfosporosinus sp.]|nr:extracellular solute-binding protein [Desulfosporosinus sp.]
MFNRSKKAIVMLTIGAFLASSILAGCGTTATPTATNTAKDAKQASVELTGQALKDAVKKEGKIVSYGMPDDWANLGEIWSNFTKQYEITHSDTDMTSAEEIAKFDAEKANAVADIGDVGITFGNVAISRDVVQPHKGPTWNEVPDWAKDKNGLWTAEYVGTIAFLVNTKLVKTAPQSWADLLKPEYKGAVVTGDVLKAAQSQTAVLAAAFANGGDEKNLTPGFDYFKKLAKAGNLKLSDNVFAVFQKGEIPVGILWDFNALGYRSRLADKENYQIVIPSDGTVSSAYVSIINKYAPHPNAAKAFQDYLLSDEGQILLAKGFARPIRDKVQIPADVAKNMVPKEQYTSAKPIKDFSAWEADMKTIPDLWRNNVVISQ